MSAVQWRPLSTRLKGVPAATAWREPVPAALEGPLRDWVAGALSRSAFPFGMPRLRIASRVVLRLNLVLPDAEDGEDDETLSDSDEEAREFLAYGTPVGLLPDVADAVLDLLPVSVDRDQVGIVWKSAVAEMRGSLRRLLDDALSVLQVRADGRGLERRSDALAEAALTEAVKGAQAAPSAGSAAAHLRAAWESVYALHPDPGKAYGEAIKAVESAAHAVVEPRRAKATLGTMLGQLRTNPDRFSLVIVGPEGRGDVGPLIECLTLLWEGQSSRHGSSVPTREETLEEATMALHLAVMLVQWFTSGAVRRSGKNLAG